MKTSAKSSWSIGALAKKFGLPTETVRYYEREGLLAAPSRSESNYRVYSKSHRERLAFIRNCRALDMTLEEVRALLAVKDEPSQSCEAASALIDSHIEHVAERIKELRELNGQLKALREQCEENQRAGDCAIIQGLSTANEKTAKTKRLRRTHLG